MSLITQARAECWAELVGELPPLWVTSWGLRGHRLSTAASCQGCRDRWPSLPSGSGLMSGWVVTVTSWHQGHWWCVTSAGEGGVQRGPGGDLWPGADDGQDWSWDDHGHSGHTRCPAHRCGQGNLDCSQFRLTVLYYFPHKLVKFAQMNFEQLNFDNDIIHILCTFFLLH